MAPQASGPPMSAPVDASSRGSVRLPCALRAAVGGSRWSHRVMLAPLPQLDLDFHKDKVFCIFNPLIFRIGIFRSPKGACSADLDT